MGPICNPLTFNDQAKFARNSKKMMGQTFELGDLISKASPDVLTDFFQDYKHMNIDQTLQLGGLNSREYNFSTMFD